MRFIFLFIVLLIGSVFGLGYWRTWQMQQSPLHEEFINGEVPTENLDGFYAGSADFPTGPWQGKTFDSNTKTGANVIHTVAGEFERFRFKTSLGPGLQNPDREVLKIDYDVPTNSWPLRLILDELVEVEPDKYLGKMHVRMPYLPPFTLVYFRLEMSESKD